MRVLVIPSWYSTKNKPNNGVFFKEQTKILNKNGIKSDVFFLNVIYRNTPNEQTFFKLTKRIDDGITVYRVDIPSLCLGRFPKIFSIYIQIIGGYFFKKYIKNNSYDLIQAHSFFIGGIIASRVKRISNIPFVLTEHSSKILLGNLNKSEEKIMTKVFKNANKSIAVSNNLKKIIEKKTGVNTIVCPNVVDEIFYFKEKKNHVFTFVSIGNLIPLKRMDLLIDGFALAYDLDKNIQLLIIGEGEMKENLLNKVNKYKLSSKIKLLGRCDRNQVKELLQKSNCMILLSVVETFGIAYIEALATGNVIIATNNGGANDIVNNSNGLILKEANKENIASAMLEVKKIYTNYNLKKISNDCINKYGEIAYFNKIKHIYESVLNSKQYIFKDIK